MQTYTGFDYTKRMCCQAIIVCFHCWSKILAARKLDTVAVHCEVSYLFTDECCLLPNQVLIPQLNPPTKTVAVASPVLFYQALPIQVCVTCSIKTALVVWTHKMIQPV